MDLTSDSPHGIGVSNRIENADEEQIQPKHTDCWFKTVTLFENQLILILDTYTYVQLMVVKQWSFPLMEQKSSEFSKLRETDKSPI